jgi:hypothetical protein
MANYRYSTREEQNNKYNKTTIIKLSKNYMTIMKVNTQRRLASSKEKTISKYTAVRPVAY